MERVGLRLQLRKQQAEAGDIVLLYGDESEALTHPYLARAWAKSGADLRVPGSSPAELFFRKTLDSCERLMRTPSRASISARRRGIVQLRGRPRVPPARA